MAESRSTPRRMTRQRAAVIAALEARDDFLSAQELYEGIRRDGSAVGLTTIYRTLQALADDGLVDVIVRSDGESVYRQCSTHHHHHLVCRKCRATVEVEAPSVEHWAQHTAREHGYADVTHTLEIFGLCPECADR